MSASAPGAPLSRRALLARGAVLPGALALPAPLAALQPRKAGTPVAYADMHVHLFNAHDLPVGPFLVEVLFRAQDLPRALKAVIHILVSRIQPLAMSAREERLRLAGGEGPGASARAVRAWTPQAFGAEIGAWVRDPAPAAAGAAGFAAGDPELAAGYDELIEAVLADSGLAGVRPGAMRATDPQRFAAAVDLAFARLAAKAEGSEPEAPGERIERAQRAAVLSQGARREAPRCSAEPCPERPYSMSIGAILRYLGWAYLMMKSREQHLADYARMAGRQGERPQTVLNHLVDYDAWLGEARLPGSSHEEQVDVAAELGRLYAVPRPGRPAIEVRTFAGFCPLKHALETRRAGRASSFEAQLRQFDEGKLAGFKLYPPMGFQAAGNAALRNSQFDPRSAYREAHFRAWSAQLGGPAGGHQIGTAIDRALDAFFSACEARAIPIMAHAGPGNAAGPGFGERANPSHWYHVARQRKLKISLGHLVNSAADFVCAVRSGTAPQCVWALGASRLLLDPAHPLQATVYGDLGFMPELIEDRALAVDFFRCLRTVYGGPDPGLTRIFYGSDYVMIGTMRDYQRHLRAMREAMRDAGYGAATIENILTANARRFLSRPA